MPLRMDVFYVCEAEGCDVQSCVAEHPAVQKHASGQDIRDHLNELAELATRASGFMGTGFAAEATWL